MNGTETAWRNAESLSQVSHCELRRSATVYLILDACWIPYPGEPTGGDLEGIVMPKQRPYSLLQNNFGVILMETNCRSTYAALYASPERKEPADILLKASA